MPEDYQDLVLATYKKKCEERKLHLNLLKPTVVKLKKECLKKYDASDEAKDVFSDFFDKDKMDDISVILSKADPGDFRPLLNHINGATKRTDEKNSELLAWLIDFQPRPSTTYYKNFDGGLQKDIKEVIDTPGVKTDDIQTEITDGNDHEDQNHEDEVLIIDEGSDKKGGLVGEVKEPIVETTDPDIIDQPIDQQSKKEETIIWDPIEPYEPVYIHRFSPRYITISCVILLLVGTTSFAIWERLPTTVRMPEQGEKFMYWDDDHYESVKDEKQDVGAAIIPLNIQTLTQQQKITLPDTLTSYSIGKVWYKGHGKNHEFFTFSGAYPSDTSRILKPLSNNILTKYTSNHRYMLTRLVWFLCAAFFITLCGIGVSRLKKEVKSGDQTGEVGNTEVPSLPETAQVMNEAELKVVQV